MSNLSKLMAEAIGTFALCFIGAGAICMATMKGFAPGVDLLAIAIAHGLILSIAVSATMNISGGHVNPAVTVSMLVTGRIKPADAIQYILAQLLGGIVAGLLVLTIFGDINIVHTDTAFSVVEKCGLGTPAYDPASLSMGKAILIEAALTFLLVFAVFGTAVDPRAPKIGGFGIGLTIAADILLGGPLTGAAMNPARTFGPGIVAFISGDLPAFFSQQLVYWIGPILGAVIAGLIYDKIILAKQP